MWLAVFMEGSTNYRIPVMLIALMFISLSVCCLVVFGANVQGKVEDNGKSLPAAVTVKPDEISPTFRNSLSPVQRTRWLRFLPRFTPGGFAKVQNGSDRSWYMGGSSARDCPLLALELAGREPAIMVICIRDAATSDAQDLFSWHEQLPGVEKRQRMVLLSVPLHTVAGAPTAGDGQIADPEMSQWIDGIKELITDTRPALVVFQERSEQGVIYNRSASSAAMFLAGRTGLRAVEAFLLGKRVTLATSLMGQAGLPVISLGRSRLSKRDFLIIGKTSGHLVTALQTRRSELPASRALQEISGNRGGLTAQTLAVTKHPPVLYFIRRNQVMARFPVATGIADCTPVGAFRVVFKDCNRRNSAGRVIERHLMPELGDYWLGLDANHPFTGVQYGIHGTNEPGTIGTQSSRGCVRLRNEDLTLLYPRVNLGTRVFIIQR